MDCAEGSWWYRGRYAAIDAVLKTESFHSILDYGAGFGAMFNLLKKRAGGGALRV